MTVSRVANRCLGLVLVFVVVCMLALVMAMAICIMALMEGVGAVWVLESAVVEMVSVWVSTSSSKMAPQNSAHV